MPVRGILAIWEKSHTALIIFLKRFQAVSSAAMPVLARGALCPSPLVDAAYPGSGESAAPAEVLCTAPMLFCNVVHTYNAGEDRLLSPVMTDAILADGGSWPCEEHGCPNASVSCALLSKEGVCTHLFANIWDRPPRPIASLMVWEACPASCGMQAAVKRRHQLKDDEHRRGACLAASGKAMNKSSGMLIHGWSAWVALRAAGDARQNFDATLLCSNQCAASDSLGQECLTNCAHGVGHGLFHASLDGSEAFNCSQLFERPSRLPELHAGWLDARLQSCPRSQPYECESGFLHSYFASVRQLRLARVYCPPTSRAYSMCLISQQQFAPASSADGHCSAEGSVCELACLVSRDDLWKTWRQVDFDIDRLPCSDSQLALCTAVVVYQRSMDRSIQMRRFCDDPFARALLARLAPRMPCTGDFSVLMRVILQSGQEQRHGLSSAAVPAANPAPPTSRVHPRWCTNATS